MNNSDSKANLNTFIITNVILSVIFLIGLYIQIKIIIVSKQEKDMTWRIDICHSVVMITHFSFRILFAMITYIIPSLHQYTGKWLCYVGYFAIVYGYLSVVSHSLVISIHKYIFIVHQNRIHVFGVDRASLIAFWINLIFPAVFAVSIIGRPWNILMEYYTISSIFNCLGMDEKATKTNKTYIYLLRRFLFCGFDDYDSHDTFFGHVMNGVNMMGCFITSILLFIVLANIMEGFLYRQIFVYMKR